MKTRHIIAVGLLSALAVGLLAFGISKSKYKPKTLQTDATSKTESVTMSNGLLSYTIQIDETTIIQQDLSIYPNWYGYINVEHRQNSTLVRFEHVHLLSFTILNNNDIEDITYAEADDAFYEYWVAYRENNITYPDTPFISIPSNLTLKFVRIEIYELDLDTDNIEDYTEGILKVNLIAYYGDNTHTYNYASKGFIQLNAATDYFEDLTPISEAIENWGSTIQIDIYTDETALNTIYTQGYNTGVAIGYDATALSNPIDFAPMMLNILTMPFTFISQAFDVTLWPGTQYQINIGNFIKAMIAISAILFIIRLFTSGFSIIGNYSANVQNHKLTKQKIAESKARTNLINRTDPNHKTSHKTSVNHNNNHKE